VPSSQFQAWRTSSYSGSGGGNCVEVAPAARAVGVRDTKAREFGHLAVSRDAFAAFVEATKRR